METSVTIFFELNDEKAFRQAACDRARADDLGEEEARSYLDAEETTIGACAIMLFDPGMSPPGCSIVDSSAG
ncbi:MULTISPECIES: hypothetical protein [Pseudomonadota]|uniref:Uncharacterized protein n=1 Tax=Rhodanobacter denitrificans TaxID=666685 RepID=M4NEB1_9GAMM|nr:MULTISPECIES: hypothetical protein [Pseudomonadota]AGG89079.1 hypothetical protein R2APBS1_1956 [Rhodanobacter denitrificans]TAN25002.1 MAG: hypothetical protein EPN31_16315 [Castellaniella sp.]UJJ53106.1 hypothetical protein LRK52_18545 [Rhodanobacter denitrificans]